MMLHFMAIYDCFLDEAVKRKELGMMPAVIGEVIEQSVPRTMFGSFLKQYSLHKIYYN